MVMRPVSINELYDPEAFRKSLVVGGNPPEGLEYPPSPREKGFKIEWEHRGITTSAVIHPEDVGAFVKFMADRGADSIAVSRL